MRAWLVIFFISFNLLASTCEHTDSQFSCVKYLGNYDGDTITFKIPNIHSYFGSKAKVRLFGIDTPELHPKAVALPCEVEWGRVAKKLVQSELNSAKRIDIKAMGPDKYGRILGEIFYDGKNLGQVLLKNHLAIPYNGGKKNKINWCDLKALREKNK
ncbi:MAG: thermonuclease family protein [Bacteriovoracaceae bacterium]